MRQIWKHRYQIIEEAGRGGSGKVYKVWDLHLEKEWAMKVLEDGISRIESGGEYERNQELQMLKRISHPNFPRIVDAFEEEGKNILIMDYIQGITLESMISRGPMEEEEIAFIMLQVCESILYLHQNTPALLYLDLKPSNIIIEENRTVKLVDLGSVSVKGKGGYISGSFGYASPEQIKVRQNGVHLTEQSDIFSFGMVLYAMAAGNSSRLPMIEENSRYGVFVRKRNPFLSVSLEKMIEKCTRGKTDRRYGSMREVKRDLEHWAMGLKKKERFCLPLFSWGRNRKVLWYQEKSIFCTEGKHSLYIAKKILVLLIGILWMMPQTVTLAGNGREICYPREVEKSMRMRTAWQDTEKEILEDKDLEKDILEESEKLGVVIRDFKLRKILVKKGCTYETSSSILLEIPWQEIEGENCRILVECEDESQKKKQFSIECVYYGSQKNDKK